MTEKLKVFDLPVPSSDLSAEEKKLLYALFEQYGMSQSTCFLRFFTKGFDEWELLGIDSVKADYLERHKQDLLLADFADEDGNIVDGDRGYAAVLALNADEPGGFYTAIKEARLVRDFKEEMLAKGMSQHTTYTRFTEDDWKPWERLGVKAVINEFLCNLNDTE